MRNVEININGLTAIKTIKSWYRGVGRRFEPVLFSLLLLITAVIPLLTPSVVHAYGQVTSRSITMSTSSNSATGVSYAVSFTTATTSAVEGIIVDFCANDPIISDSCTAPTGFSVGAGTLSPNVTCSTACAAGTWVGAAQTGSANRTLQITNATSNTINSGVTISFTLTTVTNPTSAVGPFYARILTYATTAGATGYVATAPATGAAVVDAGGIALSTANQLTITAKVQEQLTFCLYESAATAGSGATTGDGGNCSGSGNTVTLGNTNGVLSAAGPYVDLGTHYDIQTNALHGAVLYFKGAPPTTPNSNVLESSTLSGTGAAATTSYASTTGAPQFGLCSWAVSGTTANLTIQAPYNGGTCSSTTQSSDSGTTGGTGTAQFGFDIASAASSTGDELAAFPNAGSYATGDIAFLGNIANTTVAGIYTTTLTFIATSTY
jgi:hypothetical protein